MSLWDLHLHTNMSYDGNSTVDEVCEAAIARGLSGIAITNHFDRDGILAGIYSAYDIKTDAKLIREAREKYRGRLDVVFGVEIGQAHIDTESFSSEIRDAGFEYILSSLHNLNGVPDYYYFDFTKLDLKQCRYWWERYLFELTEVALALKADTLGHITYPLRYIKRSGKTFDTEKYAPRFEELFKILIKQNTALEVNVSGLRDSSVGMTLPDRDIVELYRQCGGKLIAIGSDAHYSKDVGAYVEEQVLYWTKRGMDVLNTREKIGKAGI
ncbi:MAG: histidinol-phosphatase HisJ family protein [Firmicutes bacterium]|nr:histidinol-phosphatase HisJ family protein [Bacillota bacterium]